MGFKCSVLGHRFGEPGLVNEREERGDEVIDVKRKVMVCSICGEERVLAEHKEITKQTCRGERGDSDDEIKDGSVVERINDAVGEDDAVEDGVIGEGDATPAVDGTESGSGFAGVDVLDSDPVETNGATPDRPAGEDGVILSDADSEPDQPESEWTVGSSAGNGNPWHPSMGDPGSDGETASEPITAATDDGEILTPQSAGEASSKGPEVMWAEPATTDVPRNQPGIDETLSCSTCEFSVIAADSPFRAGDICPQCHDAYLAETSRDRHDDSE